ncbi:MAG: hypothetical protein AAGF11_12480 [Myxococcota bacterium]
MKIMHDVRGITPGIILAMATTLAAGCGDDGSAEGGTSTGEDPSTGTAMSPSTGNTQETDGPTSPGTSTGPDSETETDSADTSTGSTGPEICDQASIELPDDDFFPEGTAYDAEGVLYVASLANGSLVRATPCESEVEELVASGGPLRNPVGMIVDDANGWLIVCDSDFSFMTPPSIDVLELDSGNLVATHEFDAVGFCNDLALDGDGNVYATDSAGARVLRVQAADLDSDSPAETWVTDPDFEVGEGEFGLNGIAYDDNGSLYVVNFQQGEMHRITIEASGDAGAITPITIDGGPLMNPDGMKWMGDGTLLVIEGGLTALSRVTLDGDNASSEVVQDGFDFPTTFALLDGSAWVAQGQLDHFLDGSAPEPPFVVTRVAL